MILHIVCPFCDREHPIPLDFDDVYDCGCGACYRICSSTLLEKGMNPIDSHNWDDNHLMYSAEPLDKPRQTTVGGIWGGNPLPLFEDEEMGLCQVVVDREFDQLISLKQCMDDISEMRFCKYDPSAELALVWMKRPF